MNRDDLRGWLLGTKLSMPARFVFVALTLHANGDGRAWPSISKLSAETGASPRTVQRALRELVECGDVAAEERHGSSSVYWITTNPRHSDTPVTVTPPSHSRRPLPNPTRTRATVTPEGISKDPGRGARSSIDDNGGVATFLPGTGLVTEPERTSEPPPDRARNVAGVHAAREAKRAARSSATRTQSGSGDG